MPTPAATARLAPLEPPYGPEVQSALDRMMPPGIEPLRLFRTIAHNPGVLDGFRALGGVLLYQGSLEHRDREVVIHRTCARCASDYEFWVHVVVFGRGVGFSDEQVASLRDGSAADDVWSAREALLIRLVDELHDTATASDELWEALAAEWSAEQLVELLAIAGFYHLVSFMTNGARIEHEPWAAPGAAPDATAAVRKAAAVARPVG